MGAVASCAGRQRTASEGCAPQQIASCVAHGCSDEAVRMECADGLATSAEARAVERASYRSERTEPPLLRTIRELASLRRLQPGDSELTLPGTACGPDPLDEAAAQAFDLPPERRRTSFYPFTLSSRTPSCDCPAADLVSPAGLSITRWRQRLGGGSGGGYVGHACTSAPPHGQQANDAAGPCPINACIGGTSDPLWQLGGARISVVSVTSTGGRASVRSLSMPGSSPVVPQAGVPAAAAAAAGAPAEGTDVGDDCEVFERHTYGGCGGAGGGGGGGGAHVGGSGWGGYGGEPRTASAGGAPAAAPAAPRTGVGARAVAAAGVADSAGKASAAQKGATAESGSGGCTLPQLSPRQQQHRHDLTDAGHSNSRASLTGGQGQSEAVGGGTVGSSSSSSPSGRPTEPQGALLLPPLASPSSPPQPQQEQHLVHGRDHHRHHHHEQQLPLMPPSPPHLSGDSTAGRQALRGSRRSCDGAFAGGSCGGRSRADCDDSEDEDEDDLGLGPGGGLRGSALHRAAGAQVAAALTTKSTGTLLQLPDLHSCGKHAHHHQHHHQHQQQRHDCDDDPHHPGYHYLHHQQEQDARLARAQARSRSRGGWRHSDCGEYSLAQTAAATSSSGGGRSASRRFADCGGGDECNDGCSGRNRCGSSTCSGGYGSHAGEEAWRVGASGSLGSGTGPLSAARTASVLHGMAAAHGGQGGAELGTSAGGGGQLPQFSKSSASLAASAVSFGGAALMASTAALSATTGHSTAATLNGPSTAHLRINLRAALPGTVTSRAALAADLVRCLSHARRHGRGGSGSGGDGSGGGNSPTASAAPSPLMGEGGYNRARSRRERP